MSFFINAYNIGPSFTGEFEDSKGVIGIHKSKKDKQHNGKKKKKDKMTNNDLQTLHIKLKIE